MTARILIVDDEPQLLRALRIHLTARRYEVAMAADGFEALDAAARRVPDLFLLDLGLGNGGGNHNRAGAGTAAMDGAMDGIDVIASLRGWSKAPILVLSGRVDSADQVAAFDAGADDYMTKPFVMEELMARIRALLRRADSQRKVDLAVVVGNHVVDMIAKTVVRSEQAPSTAAPTIHLTKTEWAVLEVLVKNPGRVVPSKKLLQDVWGAAYTKETGYLRFYMAKLRKKLEPDPSRPRQLVTEAGTGYRFQP